MGFKYQQIVDEVTAAIKAGLLTGKLDSVRQYARDHRVGVSTVTQAYLALERQDWIYAKPKRGYFVDHRMQSSGEHTPNYGQTINRVKAGQSLAKAVQFSFNDPDILPLSCTAPSSVIDHEALLNRLHRQVVAQRPYKLLMDTSIEGLDGLRYEICRHLSSSGQVLTPDNVLITNGRQDGLLQALMAAKAIGKTVAVESPVSFYFQAILTQLNIDVIEVPQQIDYRDELALLSKAYQVQPFTSLLVNPSFSDPTGRVLSDGDKLALIDWAVSHKVSLIEYDRSELYFGRQRPSCLVALVPQGSPCKVISIGDFYDTLSPTISLGYLICCNTFGECQFTKQTAGEEPSIALQLMVHKLMETGQYHKLMSKLREQLMGNYIAAQSILTQYLPQALAKGLYISQPEGGPCIWFKLPNQLSSEALWQLVIADNLSIAPGQMFTFSHQADVQKGDKKAAAYQDCFRITFGLPWTDKMQAGIKRLAQIIESYVIESSTSLLKNDKGN
ncbi:PLP-dependent aminotransferase family protein [Shewanella sp. D64]|uniref:aminotransferase-like domain-containing protein n=1 Tax=unclassified Shewanella TaxID=196818 RepID=UPI0022BA42C6|nr:MULTISPECIES: PLP-dependent aminotransferase family protein [unclassified Shewanella]MEC4727925.1 PLP-dependent aminotransferase family protein [Shewanella sp. D64]MEC4740103.1 PLP-dependent aminotransferase family protein [Shewanella sp. E94]WBJ95872.1 PLP-dependent aminotransferase family protein [Shewanella sp. MTB7]